MNMRMPRLTAPLCLMVLTLLLAACSGESHPYTQETEEIDPALQHYAQHNTKADMPNPDPQAQAKAEPKAPEKVVLTDAQWKEILSDEEYRILRQSGTEYGGTGRYLDNGKEDKGAYHCVGCANKLYDAKHKFHSGCGWPSFNQEVEKGALTIRRDRDGYRVEMLCARCDGHLGHIFNDAPGEPTGLRHCVNGGALIFIPQGKDPADVIKAHRAKYADQ